MVYWLMQIYSITLQLNEILTCQVKVSFFSCFFFLFSLKVSYFKVRRGGAGSQMFAKLHQPLFHPYYPFNLLSKG